MPRDVIVIKCTRPLSLTMLVTHDVPETLIKNSQWYNTNLSLMKVQMEILHLFHFSYFDVVSRVLSSFKVFII